MPEPVSTAVILNPRASGGAGIRIWPRIRDELIRRRIDFTLFPTESPGHAYALSREALRSGATRILVVGGDGTVHEVANGLLQNPSRPPPLVVVPVGTGNDFYRMVGSTRGVARAVSALEDGELHMFDVGRVQSERGSWHFVNLLGVGVDVEVLRVREKFHRLRGLPQYLAALAWTLVTFRPELVRISLRSDTPGEGSENIEGTTLLAAVTVGPSIGGGFLLSPDASPEDGLLDLCVVGPVGLLRVAYLLPGVIRGTLGDVPEIRQRRFAHATMERPDGAPLFFEMDGERMPDPVSRITVDVRPSALPVLLPRRSQ